MQNIENRVIAITGANSGLGEQATLNLAKEGAQVLMLCRNLERGQAAQKEIIKKTDNSRVVLIPCDLASFKSVQNCAKTILDNYSRLDALINNAGVIQSKREETIDGHELHFQVNYLSHFLLTNLLLDSLNSNSGKIINMSSFAHRLGFLNLNDLDAKKFYFAVNAYGQAKIANAMFTYELSKRNKGDAKVNCFDPGFVKTNFAREKKGYVEQIMKSIMPFFEPVSKSGQALSDLVSSPSFSEANGKYFVGNREAKSSRASYNQDTSAHLWNISKMMLSEYLK